VAAVEIESPDFHGLPIEYVNERIRTEHYVHDAAENVLIRPVYHTHMGAQFKRPRAISPEADSGVVHRNRTASKGVDLDAVPVR
jgi:hypothetical protein